MKKSKFSLPWPSLCFGLALALSMPLKSHAKINYNDAFPGLTFKRPLYFGVFPGKAKTYVVLEQHEGNVLLVSQKGTAWVKDTLYHLEVHWENEMGLLGIAFHPDFVNNRRYFIAYDPDTMPIDDFFNIVEERTVDATLLKDSRNKGVELFRMKDKYRNHNGGTLVFGPKDGYLYIGTGDGGLYNDPDGNAQNTNVLFGKILRIDVNKKERINLDGKDSLFNYGIPTTNPFALSGGRKEVYAYGLRNPWKFSFDPEYPHDLWAGDVGQGTFEEVDIIKSGGNYGWKVMEGPKEVFGTSTNSMILPVYSYGRSLGISVTGGEIYRADPSSKYYGSYFLADYNARRCWTLKKNAGGEFTATLEDSMPAAPSSFGTDEMGRLYFCGLNDGKIYRLDSPDLGPRTVNIRDEGRFPGYSNHKVFHITRGKNLDASLFSGVKKIEVYTVKGKHVTTLTAQQPQLSMQVEPGVYLVRKTSLKESFDLWVVHD